MSGNESFGQLMRRKRSEMGFTLRKFAQTVKVSPTYVSQIERGELKPPAEDKIREIARVLKEDADELLALANKVSSDLPEIIQQHPKEVAAFLRTARGFSREEWETLRQDVEKKTPESEDRNS